MVEWYIPKQLHKYKPNKRKDGAIHFKTFIPQEIEIGFYKTYQFNPTSWW